MRLMTKNSLGAARPRVICLMAASVDGRIVADKWPDAPAVRREYEAIHASYAAEGWMCGRVTMEPFAGEIRSDTEVACEYTGPAREDFAAPGEHESFAVAIDAHGKLGWKSNDIDGDHIIAVLSDRVSDDYLAFLRQRGVSYVLAGKNDLDLALALEKLAARFGIRTLMLEGGGGINGGMLAAGLIDEVSILVAPVVDGRLGTPAVFDVNADANPRRLALETVERKASEIIWLRYRVD
jgi:2,5-diamino-6-(ribosylamino)-4(3H)-pyrimidinone 5'-phosphate reductase